MIFPSSFVLNIYVFSFIKDALLIKSCDFLCSILDSYTYVLSRRGKPQLCYQGYLFNSDAIKNGRVYWRCSETRRSTCAARLLTIQDKLIEKQPSHDHLPNVNRLDGKTQISFEECYTYFLNSQKILDSKMKQELRRVEYLEEVYID